MLLVLPHQITLRFDRDSHFVLPIIHVDLDFDHQFIPAHKFDAKYSYKQDFGYFPGWASIGGIIVGGENRDGNTNVRFHQEDTLRRIMDRVTSELGVVIERFRADCGSFSKDIIQTVEQRCNTFYIRAANCGSRYENFQQLKEWKDVEVGYEKCDVTSISIDSLIEGKSYRLVVQRSPLKGKDGSEQTDMFGVIYTYRCILTNNRTSTEKDIITFYNERGASEKVKPLKKISRLKAFILHFVSVLAKWVRTGRQNVLNLYTNKAYYSEVFLE